MKILVTGGCGYIGSHTIVDLLEHGYEVISVDNLVNSTEAALHGIYQITGKRVRNYQVDLCDEKATAALFQAHPDLHGVIHFAALKSVAESVAKPELYFRNNLLGLLNVLAGCRDQRVPYFIFSSSCSVYGNTQALPVVEETPWEQAESPYARTKQMGEWMVRDVVNAVSGLQAGLMRYFNPAGAHPSGRIGEAPSRNITNLVPLIMEVATGKREALTVFGEDYATRDGSCVRDYIHIMDLARAHTQCLQYLEAGRAEQAVEVFNVGIGEGATVLEVIAAFEKVVGRPLPYRIGPRRPGDVAAIYSDYARAKRLLGWTPQHTMEDIMRSAWTWEMERGKEGTT